MKKLAAILLAGVCLLQTSCGQRMDSISNETVNDTQLPLPDQKSSEPEKIGSDERKMIREGDISFETSDLQKTRASIGQTVNSLDGYISDENTYSYGDRKEQRLVIRIPSNRFDTLIQTITKNADKLDNKSVRVLDVTEEYIDVESRIRTKKELKERYQELLKKANTVTDMVAIEKEIGQLQTEIESVEGRMKYLKDRISFSTLSVTFYQKASASFGFFGKLTQAIRDGWSGFLSFIIGLAYLWVFVLIGAGIFYWFVRRKRRRK